MTAHDPSLDLEQGAAPEAFIEVLSDWLVRLPTDALSVADAAEEPAGDSDLQATLRTACGYLLRVMSLHSQIEDLVAAECAIVLRVAVHSALAKVHEDDPRLNVLGQECKLLEEIFPKELPKVREHLAALRAKDATQSSNTNLPTSEPERGLAESADNERSSDPAEVHGDELSSTLREQIASWGETYSAPEFGSQAHALVRLRAFLCNRKVEVDA